MGLDVALGVIILIAAIRGWLQGFVYQVVRIAGLVACIYLAAPVRDQARPHVIAYLPKIQPELMDRLMWWVSAAISYAVLVGVTTLAIKMTRRPEIPGIPAQSPRKDQSAGFLLGAAKGVLVALFLTAGIQEYALKQIATIPWADQQVKTSLALRWNEQYQPAGKIWSSPPVQQFVSRIQQMGLQSPPEGPGQPDAMAGDRPVVQTASRPTDVEDVAASKPRSDTPKGPAKPPATIAPKLSIGADPTEILKAIDAIEAADDAKPKKSD
jgi:uncharacterized membrane protein required for colicin V production